MRDRIGHYRVRRVISQGGMGVVLLAEDDHGRPVAIKQVHAHMLEAPGVRERFLRESRIAAGLRHPNIVAVLDVGTEPEGPYLAMEYVAGGTLADELARRGPASAGRLLEVAGQSCAALAYAHRAGVVHRDITPRNLLLTPDGTIKVADFGIARTRDDTRLTMTGSVLGTVRYLAPEQAAGHPATPASDLYALGVVLYELAAGRPPYEAGSLAELVLRQQTERPTHLGELRPDLPAPIPAAVMACLARDPGLRPPSAAALAAHLGLDAPGSTQVIAGPSQAATEPLPAAPRPRRARPRRVGLVAAGSALVVAGALVAAALATRGGGDRPPPSSTAVRPAPTAPTPAGQARQLATWLRAQSG
jgi:eukaryotic-like serine/threonine-protein kinase